jgi:dienelactone hydrolase
MLRSERTKLCPIGGRNAHGHLRRGLRTQAGSQGNRAAAQSRFVVYPDAPHAFHADYRASYRPAPAADGFGQAVAWLRNPQQS